MALNRCLPRVFQLLLVVLCTFGSTRAVPIGKAFCDVNVNSQLAPGILDRVTGMVTFTQVNQVNMTIAVSLKGFDTTDPYLLHGFHIHEFGDLSEGCDSMGSHYNPTNNLHGPPTSPNRHIGDLGNIQEDADGRVITKLPNNQLTKLFGMFSILGKGLVIHQQPDDLSTDGDGNGNAGARIACCIIRPIPL